MVMSLGYVKNPGRFKVLDFLHNPTKIANSLQQY